MKKNYLSLLGLSLLLVQSGNLFAGGPSRYSRVIESDYGNMKADSEDMVNQVIQRGGIDKRYKDFLRAAAIPNSRLIMQYRSQANAAARYYPSNVLRAALDIARRTQGETGNVYQVLESILSYK